MSTFKGVIKEFPDITVDYFRPRPGMPLPLACFLSHIHSDHLDGLVSFKSPFIYCSPATKELLVRLEPKVQRVWFANRITESRKRTYKHLRDVLKAIPLETPTKIELKPGNEIQVTLFDANHCTGAVMFLFEGQGKAVLYTGDIRSEPWWVNNLIRNPSMIEYSSGLKKLDCIYLDTSNTKKIDFPTKADGLRELLQKVSKYPKDTVFHISSWTFGYEEVWMTLSKALNSTIHVDTYKYRLYKSLCGNSPQSDAIQSSKGDPSRTNIPPIAAEGSVLIGYKCGNTFVPGCLTQDHAVRLHSCENGTCHLIDKNENVVWIRPIIARTRDGAELAEVGIGGGGEDLSRDLEMEIDDSVDIEGLLKLLEAFEDPHAAEVKRILAAGWHADSKRLILNGSGLNIEEGSLTPSELVTALRQSVIDAKRLASVERMESQGSVHELPRIITFPYSRHASYDELCGLVKAFEPRDVYPCTVDEQRWDEGNISISSLFGQFCSGWTFRHEQEMDAWRANRREDLASQQTHTTTTNSQSSQMVTSSSPERTQALPIEAKLENLPSRDSTVKSGPFDQAGNEISLTGLEGKVTPPRQILAVSPNSASQNLRRKAIHEQLKAGEVKRIRRNYDGSPSSGTTNTEVTRHPAVQRAGDEVDSTSSFEGDITLGLSGGVELHDIQISTSAETHDPAAIISHYASDAEGWSDQERFDDEKPDGFDPVDEVFRCLKCGHELWGGSEGFCTGSRCDRQKDNPYVEFLDPEAPPLPEIALNEETEELLEGEMLKTTVGPCLDYDSSAYDSMDSNCEFQEEYDSKDSFIDDSESGNGGDGPQDHDPSNDDEPDYEAMYNQLRATHSELIDDYVEIDDAFRTLRRELGAAASEDDDDDDEMDEEDMDEDGMYIVEVKNPDPVTTEIVVSHALEESQESEVSEERIRARARAFEAAQESSGWYDIEMVSTTGNHTIPEIEL